jgi:Mg2+ and Co2+ transporter CorA
MAGTNLILMSMKITMVSMMMMIATVCVGNYNTDYNELDNDSWWVLYLIRIKK